MKRIRNLSVTMALASLVVTGLLALPASAATTTGTWVQYPNGTTEYQAAVQQPINTANTSNWNSKSKGAIPVMFKLSSRTGPAAFESIYTTSTTDDDAAFMSFTPSPSITFNDITTLKTDYAFTLGDCHGGSLRWSVRTSATQSVFIYYGGYPNFTDCTTGANNQSGVNMIGQPDLRYDTSQYPGGTFYDTYSHAQTLVGTTPVIRASLVIDAGWAGDQRLNVSNTTVNDNEYDFVSAGNGDFTPTCDLPDATIEVGKTDPVANGEVNEAPVQSSLADDGNTFRVVDCKYQYILSIPSLNAPRTGTYRVEIKINGVSVPTPGSPGGKVKFDIK
jgi:hypothetical protein